MSDSETNSDSGMYDIQSNENDNSNSYISEDDINDDDNIDIDDDIDGEVDNNSDLNSEDNSDNTEDNTNNKNKVKSKQYKQLKQNNESTVKKIKKQPIKSQKLPIKEALKTVEERALYIEIDRFFNMKCDQKNIQKMVRIINNDDAISLRLLNWFAMKYSATMEAIDHINGDGKIELFDVKISYRARLNTHSKKYFDPFRRGKKFDYSYDKRDKSKIVETTLCQLNFFRWMFMHELMDYVDDNFEDLKNKMGTYNTQEKKKKEKKKEKEKNKKVTLKNKKKDVKIRVKRFTEENTSKVIIII